MKKRYSFIGGALLLALVSGLGWHTYQQSESYQDRQWSALTLPQFQARLPENKTEPRFLYHFGKLLNTQERFRDAQTLLEQAAERQPDSARIRDEWAKALIGQGNITGGFNVLTQFSKTYPNDPEGHLSLARFYVSQNATGRAGEELKLALTQNPALGEAWFLQAVVSEHGGDQAAALKSIREAVARRPESAPDHALLSSLLRDSNDPSGAKKAIEKAIALDPKKASYYQSYGNLLLGEQDYTGAQKAAQEAIRCDPDSGESFLLSGQVLQAQKLWRESVSPLEKAAKLLAFSPLPADLLRKAYRQLNEAPQEQHWNQEYLSRRQETDALQHAEEVLRRAPDAPASHQEMARCLAHRGDATGVLRHLGAAQRNPVDSPTVLIAGARLLLAQKQASLALLLLRDVFKQTQKSPAAFEAMGDTLLALDRPREASIYYQTVAGWEPSKLASFKARIQQAYERRSAKGGEAEKAYQEARVQDTSRLGPSLTTDSMVELLQKAVKLAPEVTDYRRALVRAYLERKENDKALVASRELLNLSPEDTLNRAFLGIVMLEASGQEKDFAEIFAHFNAAWPDPVARPMVHYGRGLLALRRKNAEEAVGELKKATELSPDSEPAWHQLAQALQLKGDQAGARQALSESTRIQAAKQAEVDTLKAIVAQPDRPELYDRAIAFYTQRGGLAQANAIRAERQRRFSPSILTKRKD